MVWKDSNTKGHRSHPMEFFRQLTLNEEKHDQRINHVNKEEKKTKNFKKVHSSFVNFLHRHHSTDDTKKSNTNQQISIDPSANESDLENGSPNKEINSEEDLVVVVDKKPIIDDTSINSKDNIEPYPFRSEISCISTSQSNSSINPIQNVHSHHSRINLIHHLIHHHPKELPHPLPITNPINKTDRSNSAPNLLISPPLSSHAPLLSTTTTTKKKHHQRPLKPFRKWFRLSSMNRMSHSLNKKTHDNHQTNSNKNLTTSRRPSWGLRRLSELLY